MKVFQLRFFKYMQFFAQCLMCGVIIGSFFVSPSWGMKRKSDEDPENFKNIITNLSIQEKNTPEDLYQAGYKFLLEEQNSEAMELFLKAANQNYAEAQYEIGFAYLWGEMGIVQDHNEAIKWFLRAAKQNHAKAQFQLGRIYEEVKNDGEEAMKWYFLAFKYGYSDPKIDEEAYYVIRDSINSLLKDFKKRDTLYFEN